MLTIDSSVEDISKRSDIDTYSDRNSSTGSELSKLSNHTLLVETRARDLDRELYHDPDRGRCLFPSEKFFDNEADYLEMIEVSNGLKEAVRVDLEPFKQETKPLVKICCVKMEDYMHQPDELNRHLMVLKTYMKARYRLPDLPSAQRNDRITSRLKKWLENGAPDKGDL